LTILAGRGSVTQVRIKRALIAFACLLCVACETPVPRVPMTTTGNGAAGVDHCQARYESCVSHTATRWGVGVFAIGATQVNRKATNACRDNLGACYRTC
jgi:hypothetical protein